MTIEGFIIWLVIGAIAGWLASLLVKGYGIDAPTFLAAVAGPAASAVTERMVQGYQRPHATQPVIAEP